MKTNPVYLTKQGKKDLEIELDDLINNKRPENIKEIKYARSLGDLSENSEYHEARNDQAVIEARIVKIETMLENAVIIKETKSDAVNLGSLVVIKYMDETEDQEEYKIVGSHESDPFAYKISNESDMGKAILNKKVGDVVDVQSPNGVYKIEIKEIK